MKNTLQQLSFKEQEILAQWYNSESYKVVKKLIEIERLELTKDHLEVQDILQIRYLSGQAASLKKLLVTIRQHYKSKEKNKG